MQMIRLFMKCWGYKQVNFSWHHLNTSYAEKGTQERMSYCLPLHPVPSFTLSIFSLSYTVIYETEKKDQPHEYQN